MLDYLVISVHVSCWCLHRKQVYFVTVLRVRVMISALSIDSLIRVLVMPVFIEDRHKTGNTASFLLDLLQFVMCLKTFRSSGAFAQWPAACTD
jgi:hypothetical protein